MNIIGQNSSFIIDNHNTTALCVSIKSGQVMPFVTKLNNTSAARVKELLTTKRLNNVDLLLTSSFISSNCIEDNFMCHESFFMKLNNQMKITRDNFDIFIPCLLHTTKNQATFHIDLNSFGIDFNECKLDDGDYAIIITEHDGCVYLKQLPVNYCFSDSTPTTIGKGGVITKSIANTSMFAHLTVTNTHKKLLLECNTRGMLGSLLDADKLDFNSIITFWPEIEFKFDNENNVKINNIDDVLFKNLTTIDREIFFETMDSLNFIVQFEGILTKPTIRSYVAYTPI